MKTSKTPKIVIGVGLLAVYAGIFSTVILRSERKGTVTPDAPMAAADYAANDALVSSDFTPSPAEPAIADATSKTSDERKSRTNI